MGRIFYICPHLDVPIGGNKVIYRHVDILNEHGFEAYVLHAKPGFRFSWFDNETKIAYPSLNLFEKARFEFEFTKGKLHQKLGGDQSHLIKISEMETVDKLGNEKRLEPISTDDVLVFPEYCASSLFELYKDHPYVVFVQGAYISLTDNKLPKKKEFLIRDKNANSQFHGSHLKGVLVVSEDSKNLMSYIFPKLNIERLHLSIDPKLFYYSKEKKRQIAFMPRKMSQDALLIITILKELDKFKDWTICPIDGIPESEVAEKLRESAIFMALSDQEGFPLPPFESIATGCVVVGYHGQGAREIFNPPYVYTIEKGNIIEFVKTLASQIEKFETNNSEFLKQGKIGSEYIHRNFTIDRENEDVVKFWKRLI